MRQKILDELNSEDAEGRSITQKMRRARREGELEFSRKKGIPEQYGIFYGLGLALIAEGFMSATYHICPTKESFQFDTTFMYLIAILLFLKVSVMLS